MKKINSELFPLLVVDTSQSNCNLAIIFAHGDPFSFEITEELKSLALNFHFETLSFLPEAGLAEVLDTEVLNLCKKSQVNFKDLKGVLCSYGPGSFTGLRTGMAFCQGLVSALKIPLCLSSNLFAAALLQQQKLNLKGGKIQVFSEANKEEYFRLEIDVGALSSVYKGEEVGGLIASEITAVLKSMHTENRAGEGRDAKSLMLSSLLSLELMHGYFYSYLLMKGISKPSDLRLFSEQLNVLNSLDELAFKGLEPIYVKGVSAKTLKERGLI